MEPKCSLPCLQQQASGPYSEHDKCRPNLSDYNSLKLIVTLFFNLRLGLPVIYVLQVSSQSLYAIVFSTTRATGSTRLTPITSEEEHGL
jgi:hypothetical protein